MIFDYPDDYVFSNFLFGDSMIMLSILSVRCGDAYRAHSDPLILVGLKSPMTTSLWMLIYMIID